MDVDFYQNIILLVKRTKLIKAHLHVLNNPDILMFGFCESA